MRILATADLHYGVSSRGDRAAEALARHVCRAEADVLLLGGDLAHGQEALERCLALFAPFPGERLAVPGNHDVWLVGDDGRRRGGNDPGSWALHEETLPAIMRAHGVHPLHLAPRTVGGVAFVGSMGWYDYAFGDAPGASLADYRAKTFPGDGGPLWNDARYARFDVDDEALTDRLVGRLAAQVAAARTDARGGPVVALVHHVVDARLLPRPRWAIPARWRFANGFLGSPRLGAALDTALGAAPNGEGAAAVGLVICGHIHRRGVVRDRDRIIVTVGSDYERKELIVAGPDRVLTRRVFS